MSIWLLEHTTDTCDMLDGKAEHHKLSEIERERVRETVIGRRHTKKKYIVLHTNEQAMSIRLLEQTTNACYMLDGKSRTSQAFRERERA